MARTISKIMQKAFLKRGVHSKSLTDEEKEMILLVFIHAVLNDIYFDFHSKYKSNLLITDNDVLLKNRLWFESHFPSKPLNIATVEEALEIMDLFAKKKGVYYTFTNSTANKGLWYWRSFRSKIPYYNVSTEIMEAFSSRFVYLLMSLDEMGIQYYSGVDNDTMDNTLYHFNYFISLITGIFDSLAIETRVRMQLKFERDDIQWKTSLSNKAGDDFLKVLREKNPSLRNHINSYVDFINLIYALRESAIHREGLPKTGYEYRGKDEKWQANFIKVSKDITELIKRCGDAKKPYEVTTEWGIYQDTLGYYLSPYNFAKAASLKLIEFSNTYLQMLGFPNFIQSLKPGDSFLEGIKRFESGKLGF
jgi:hypothetical protein